MLEFDTICGEGKNYTGNVNMKTLMNTAMKTIMKSSLCALAALVLSSSSAFATALDTTLFTMKSEMTIPGYAGSTTLANFPVLVRLAANSPTGFDYNDCAADGSDLRFADANGDLIPHEIDTWKTDGTSLVWVSVPTLSGTATTFTMYYGTDGASSLPAVTESDVWTGANFNAVWHFSGSSKESANGLTPSSSDSSSTAPDYTATTFDVGTCFKASNSTLGYLVSDTWTTLGTGGTLTLSTWSKFDGTSANYNRMLSCMSDWAKPAGWELTIQNASVDQITVGSSNKSQFQYTASGVGPGSGNVYLTVVYNAGGNTQLYTNGVLATAQSLNQVVKPTEKLYIGSLNKSANRWNGSLDEIRIHRDAESADWVKACYDTMANANFVAMGEALPVGGTIPLTVRLGGCTQTGTQAVIAGRLAQLGTGANSATVTLEWGTTDQLGNTEPVDTYTAAADLSATLTGLTPAATYYYAFKAVNNAETPETAWTATNSFIVDASTKLSGASASAVNCSVTVSGAVSAWGVGTTAAELLFGSSASDLAVVQTTDAMSAEPAGGMIAFDPLTRPVGTYSYAIRTITSYNGVVWTNETAVGSVTLADAASYTWKGGTGAWTDAAMWTTSDSGAAGVPSAASSVVFGDADSDVSLADNVTVAGLTVSSVGTHAFRSDKTMTTRKLTGPVAMSGTGGGTLVLDSVKFESQISDLAGLKQLVIENMGWAEAASSAATDIVLVNGGTFYGGNSSSSQRTYGKLKLVGGPNRISFSQYTSYGIRFASFEAVSGSGVPVVSIRESANNGDRPLVAFEDASGIELVGGTALLAEATSKIPVCPNFMLNDTDTLHGKGACTIVDGEVRKIPQSTMLTTLAGATETDNVCLSSDCTLDADVTVNALLFTGANIDLGGHTVTVRSGVFREGDGGMYNHLIQNGVVKLGRPDALGDGTNNPDARNKVDFAVDGNGDPETVMLAHNAQQEGWNRYATYATFVGTFAAPPNQNYSISDSMRGTNAVVEMRGGQIRRSGDHGRKSLFRGVSGVGSINYQDKWNCGLWLGDLASAEDQEYYSTNSLAGRVVVGHGGIVKPGCIDYDGGRRGCFSIPYVTPQGDLPKLSALEFRDGAKLKVTLRPDGTCSWLDASQTQSAGTFLDVTLAGDLVLEEAGRVKSGNGPWIVLKTGKETTGSFANAGANGRGIQGYKVSYNVALPDGTYGVKVEKKGNAGTIIIVR